MHFIVWENELVTILLLCHKAATISVYGCNLNNVSWISPWFWQCAIPKISMLYNLCCLKTRLRLLCNKYQRYSSLNLVSQQLKLCNIFIFGMAYSSEIDLYFWWHHIKQEYRMMNIFRNVCISLPSVETSFLSYLMLISCTFPEKSCAICYSEHTQILFLLLVVRLHKLFESVKSNFINDCT